MMHEFTLYFPQIKNPFTPLPKLMRQFLNGSSSQFWKSKFVLSIRQPSSNLSAIFVYFVSLWKSKLCSPSVRLRLICPPFLSTLSALKNQIANFVYSVRHFRPIFLKGIVFFFDSLFSFFYFSNISWIICHLVLGLLK